MEQPSHWQVYVAEGGSGVAAAELGEVADDVPAGGLDVEDGDGESSAGGDADWADMMTVGGEMAGFRRSVFKPLGMESAKTSRISHLSPFSHHLGPFHRDAPQAQIWRFV